MLSCTAPALHAGEIAAPSHTHRMIDWPGSSAQGMIQVKINGADAN